LRFIKEGYRLLKKDEKEYIEDEIRKISNQDGKPSVGSQKVVKEVDLMEVFKKGGI
jgi:hypothetical protein